ncbi:CoA transferase [Candidatus Villigracilis proximus]|uniref:CoA transferase n=1 Tax=Candidatus Villigracilis proximus TaxID=3140683 RepID=UPI0031E5A136
MKTGVALVYFFAWQNAIIAILAALQARTLTGEGQYLDIALFASQLGWLANVAGNYLISGRSAETSRPLHRILFPIKVFKPVTDLVRNCGGK